MRPGSKRFYEEWRHFHRRMSIVTTITSMLALVGAALLYSSPDVRNNLNARRFGFEGPEQYVRRIQLSSLGDPSSQRSTPQIVQPKVQKPQQKGGGGEAKPKGDIGQPARDIEAFRPPGVGDSESDILARAMLRPPSSGGTHAGD